MTWKDHKAASVKKVEEDLAAKQKEVKGVRSELDALHKRAHELSAEMSKRRKELEDVEHRIADERSREVALHSAIRPLEAQYSQLRKDQEFIGATSEKLDGAKEKYDKFARLAQEATDPDIAEGMRIARDAALTKVRELEALLEHGPDGPPQVVSNRARERDDWRDQFNAMK